MMSPPRIIGTLRRDPDGRGVVRVEDVYDTSPGDLWSALTEPARLARWVAVVSGDLRLGGTFEAQFTSGWTGPGRVDVCDPPERLVLTMSPGEPDTTVIDAVLTPEGDRTRLVVEERGLPVAELPGYGAGWQAHLEDLGRHVGGRDDVAWDARWTELTPVYRMRGLSE
jgi:uncharacterized protein YndB with AHSA1/START domain